MNRKMKMKMTLKVYRIKNKINWKFEKIIFYLILILFYYKT